MTGPAREVRDAGGARNAGSVRDVGSTRDVRRDRAFRSARTRPVPPRPGLVREPAGAFGWLDAHLLHEGWLAKLGADATAVLALLAIAADRHGASFYGRRRIAECLSMTPAAVHAALTRLRQLGLADLRPWHAGAADGDGVWQLLPVPRRTTPPPPPRDPPAPELATLPPAAAAPPPMPRPVSPRPAPVPAPTPPRPQLPAPRAPAAPERLADIIARLGIATHPRNPAGIDRR